MSGPTWGSESSHASNRGLDRAKHHAAMMKNTVDGRPGTKMPTVPTATATHPSVNHSQRAGPRCPGTSGAAIAALPTDQRPDVHGQLHEHEQADDTGESGVLPAPGVIG